MNTSIGLLATGNELTEGDILNTNGQQMARMLSDANFTVGLHVISSDALSDIEAGLHFLLAHNDIVIITGGLGPTSDDRTRYALSNIVNKKLIFDDELWAQILTRYERLGISVHENNKQQAFFPAGAEIIPNANGSAAGCRIEHNKKIIFMLPGPPNECLPMFEQFVLPQLLHAKPVSTDRKLKWRLLGVVESDIAAIIDEAVKPYPIVTGYRIDFPYLEVKIHAQHHEDMEKMLATIQSLVAPHLISQDNKTATELLKNAIANSNGKIIIHDAATHGALEVALCTPKTYSHLQFISHPETNNTDQLFIKINGLQEYWDNQPPKGKTSVTLQFIQHSQTETITIPLPFRNLHVIKYAVEYIAKEILRKLSL